VASALDPSNAESVTFASATAQPEFSQTPVSGAELNLAPDADPPLSTPDDPTPEAMSAQPQPDQLNHKAPLLSKSMILMVAAFVMMFGVVFVLGYALGRGAV
jgi:hypothetical protein